MFCFHIVDFFPEFSIFFAELFYFNMGIFKLFFGGSLCKQSFLTFGLLSFFLFFLFLQMLLKLFA